MMLAAVASLVVLAVGTKAAPGLRLSPGARVLFQGDSITDGNRGPDQADLNHALGHGYAFLLAAENGAAHPEKGWTFLNRGVTGHKVSDLAARWKVDALELKPDVLSVLVGINDVEGGTTSEAFEATYDRLLTETERALPRVKLVLCEPFGTPAGWRKATWNTRTAPLLAMQASVRKLAQKHQAVFVPLQAEFDRAIARSKAHVSPEYWLWDGIHPTAAGHALIADAWARAFNRGVR